MTLEDLKVITLPAAEKFPILLAFKTSGQLTSKDIVELIDLKTMSDRLILFCRFSALHDLQRMKELYDRLDPKSEFNAVDSGLSIFQFMQSGRGTRSFGAFSEFYERLSTFETCQFAVFADALTSYDLKFLKKLEAANFQLDFATFDPASSKRPITEFSSYLENKPDQMQLF